MKYPKLCRESVYFVFFIALDVPENSLAFLPFFFYTIQVNWLFIGLSAKGSYAIAWYFEKLTG